MRGFLIALAILAWPLRSDAQDGPRVEFQATSVWAARTALVDARTLPADVATRSRYVWLRGGSAAELAQLSFVINSTLSHVNVGILPATSDGAVPFAGGRLVRLDMGILATDSEKLANLAATWERLSGVDCDFTATISERQRVRVATAPYKARDGKTYSHRFESREVAVQGPAAHVLAELTELSGITGSLVPIIDGRELMRAALGTLEGGLYYEFRGINSNATLKSYLESRGASEAQVESLESMEKAVVLHSAVTGKERMVAVFRGAGVRASVGGGLVSLTFDPFDEDRSSDDSALRNLMDFRGRGSEVILELSNGFHEWTLWNENGNLVRVAPQNLVTDSLVPPPHTANLQPGISCLRCHAAEDGWRGIANDVPTILAAGTDIFGDLSTDLDRAKQIQLLAGLYSGDWFTVGTGPLSVGRLTYNRACFEVTGKPVAEMANLIAASYGAYSYELLDAWDVANELGIVGLPKDDGQPDTKQAACQMLAQFIAANPVDGAVAREDAIIAAIKAGIPVGRRSWQSAAHIAAERTYQRGLK